MEEHMADDGSSVRRFEDGREMFSYAAHDWFAWRPVWSPRMGWVWLKTIRRSFSVMYRPNGRRTIVAAYTATPAPATGPDAPERST